MKKILLLVIFFLLIPIIFANDVEFKINEEGQVISFYEDYYIINTNGTFSIKNPSNMNLYNIEIPLKLSGLQLILFDKTNNTLLRQSTIYLRQVNSNQTFTFNFSLQGITADDSIIKEKGILEEIIKKDKLNLNSNTVGTLNKAPLEDPLKGGKENTRLISASYFNPTNIPYFINKITIIKTSNLDISMQLDSWEFQKKNPILYPNETWNIDFLDTNAFEGEVYWLTGDIYLHQISYNTTANITIFTEEEIFKILENATNATTNLTKGSPLIESRIYLKKQVSNTHVNPGDEVDVTLLITNLAPDNFNENLLTDTIPTGFTIIDPKFGKVNENKISWENLRLNSKETKRITYKIKYNDNSSLGIDYYPSAHLTYDKKETFSQAIPFVRKYIPEKKIFIQKKIDFFSDDEVKVIISILNMGESQIKSIILNEYLNSESEFKEISKDFTTKGVWKIDSIKPGEDWKVSYITDSVGVLNTFPVVYGIPEKSVMKTIVLSNVIKENVVQSSMKYIELIAIIVIIIFIILLLLPKNIFKKAQG